MWVYGAQSYRPFGTPVQYPVVPDALAVDAPDGMPAETGRVTPRAQWPVRRGQCSAMVSSNTDGSTASIS